MLPTGPVDKFPAHGSRPPSKLRVKESGQLKDGTLVFRDSSYTYRVADARLQIQVMLGRHRVWGNKDNPRYRMLSFTYSMTNYLVSKDILSGGAYFETVPLPRDLAGEFRRLPDAIKAARNALAVLDAACRLGMR